MIGLFVAAVFGLSAVVTRHCGRVVLSGTALVAIVAFAIVAHRQVAVWQNTRTLLGHALAVGELSPQLRATYGTALLKDGALDEAVREYQSALAQRPQLPAWSNLGVALGKLGRLEEAIAALHTAVERDPQDAAAWRNLALALARAGEAELAREARQRALELAATGNQPTVSAPAAD